jgi:hypothetical protein
MLFMLVLDMALGRPGLGGSDAICLAEGEAMIEKRYQDDRSGERCEIRKVVVEVYDEWLNQCWINKMCNGSELIF